MGREKHQDHLLDDCIPDLLSLLGKEALIVAARMRGGKEEVTLAPLRQIEHWCKRYLIFSSEPSDQFTMFFLATFVHDIFFNLTGDLPYDKETEACKKQYFSILADQIAQIGEFLAGDRCSDLSSVFYTMVATYMNAIKQINQMTLKSEGANDGRDVKPQEQG